MGMKSKRTFRAGEWENCRERKSPSILSCQFRFGSDFFISVRWPISRNQGSFSALSFKCSKSFDVLHTINGEVLFRIFIEMFESNNMLISREATRKRCSTSRLGRTMSITGGRVGRIRSVGDLLDVVRRRSF